MMTVDERLRREIELRAYHRYCGRGCEPGSDLEDWLAAEREVLERSQIEPPSDQVSPDRPGDGRGRARRRREA